MNEEMFDRLVGEVDMLHAEVEALGSIFVGICAALEKRDLPTDIVHDAFDFAERTTRRVLDSLPGDPMAARTAKALEAIASLRKAALD